MASCPSVGGVAGAGGVAISTAAAIEEDIHHPSLPSPHLSRPFDPPTLLFISPPLVTSRLASSLIVRLVVLQHREKKKTPWPGQQQQQQQEENRWRIESTAPLSPSTTPALLRSSIRRLLFFLFFRRGAAAVCCSVPCLQDYLSIHPSAVPIYPTPFAPITARPPATSTRRPASR